LEIWDKVRAKSLARAIFEKYPYICKNIYLMPAEQASLLSRITLNHDICHGKPTIRNMRYPVTMILDLLGAGMTAEEIIQDYPAIEPEDIQACLMYAARLSEVKSVYKLEVA